MTNVQKYLTILESLNLIPDEKDDLRRIESNFEILKKHPDLNPKAEALVEAFAEDCSDKKWQYSLNMYQLFISILDSVNFDSGEKEDLISMKHINLLINAIQDVGVYGLRMNLHTLFRSHPVFEPLPSSSTASSTHLKVSLGVFRRILNIRQLQSGRLLNEVIRDYIAGILSIIESDLNKEIQLTDDEKKVYQTDLNMIWKETSKFEYFRNILLFKGLPDIPPALKTRLHKELISKLQSKDGFTNFVTSLFINWSADRPESDYFVVIVNIVTKALSTRNQEGIIEQIFEFLQSWACNPINTPVVGAGLLTVKRLYELKKETREAVEKCFRQLFNKLTNPEDVLVGLVIMEHQELSQLCSLLFHCFCSSSMECLPSELLTTYMPLLLKMYSHIPDQFHEKVQIQRVIVRCLANRSRPELQKVINNLVSKSYPSEWVDLHPRVLIRSDEKFTQMTLVITSRDSHVEPLNISNELPELLIASNHNILTHAVFMCLLSMMQEVLSKDDGAAEDRMDLLQDDEELLTVLNTKYPVKIEIILCLSNLVTHPSLRAQISENSSEFLEFLRTFIQQRSTQSFENQENTDRTLLLMLTITQEMIENSEATEKFGDFPKVLRDLNKQTPNELIHHRIEQLLLLLEGGLKATHENKTSPYNKARDLINEKETHLKVYGINLMIEMLRKKDKDAVANGHVTLAMALQLLKDKESYTFLNCVLLIVALVHVMEAEVLETLADEYLNEKNPIDYRLIVGEAIIKVTGELNQLCYKYKGVLVNCFINGCRSESGEFRWSSFSNLGTLCRTLTFQVQSFFQEMLILVENEIQHGTFDPAKRAALHVFTELLLGVDNLLDHEEHVLPIYRVLKTLSTHPDEAMRSHATTALEGLYVKCKEILFPVEHLEKEIKVLGINDSNTKKSKGHILELN